MTGMTEKVREAAFDLETFDFKSLCSRLRVRGRKKIEQVRNTVRYLKRTEEITSIRQGFYRYRPKQKALTKNAKIWRAICIKEFFTLKELERLTSAGKNHVMKYCVILRHKGFISKVSGKGYAETVYRLDDPSSAPIDPPSFYMKKKKNNKKSIS